MYHILTSLLFYLYAFVTIFAGVMVISLRNPVHAVLSLILGFFGAAGLFILVGAEFVAMTLIIVYVGAVAVLFLFVVMMMDLNVAELKQGFLKYMPLCIAVASVMFIDLFLVLTSSVGGVSGKVPSQVAASAGNLTNTHAIGSVLYTHYIYPFQLAGIVLFVAMVSCIVLTLRQRVGARKQNIQKQLARTREQSVALVKVNSGEGVDGIIS